MSPKSREAERSDGAKVSTSVLKAHMESDKADIRHDTEAPVEPALSKRLGLDDPRSVQILTTEHFGLIATRGLGYQEMVGRTTIFIAALSGTVITLALLAQATRFGPEILWYVIVLVSVLLFIGLGTFVRLVAINFEDARYVRGLSLLHQAYLKIVPELEPFLRADRDPGTGLYPRGKGAAPQRAEVLKSLTTSSSVVAALDSVLAGSLSSAVIAILGWTSTSAVAVGIGVSLVSAVLHVLYAARYRHDHVLPVEADLRP